MCRLKKQERPSIPEDTPADLQFIIRSCWVEEPNMRPGFSQVIRMLNAFLFTLTPPSPQPEAPPVVISSSDSTLTTNSTLATNPTRSVRKLSFLRQLFAAKRAGNSGTT